MHWQCRCNRLLPSCTGSADVTNCFHHAAHAHPDDWKRSSTRCLLSHYSVKDWNAPEGQFPTRPAESKSAYWQNSPPQRSDNVLRSSGRRGARSGACSRRRGERSGGLQLVPVAHREEGQRAIRAVAHITAGELQCTLRQKHTVSCTLV